MPEEREKDKTGSPEHEMWPRYSINYGVQSPWTQCEEGDMQDKKSWVRENDIDEAARHKRGARNRMSPTGR
jgi:hypothetical protein